MPKKIKHKAKRKIDLTKFKRKKRANVPKKSRSLKITYKDEKNGGVTVLINGKFVGEVKPYSFKWKIKPAFRYLQEDNHITDIEFSGPIEAAREIVKMWQRFSDAKEYWESEQDLDEWIKDAFTSFQFKKVLIVSQSGDSTK